MDSRTSAELIAGIARQAAFFEQEAELDGFLEEAMSLIARHTGMETAAIYLYDHEVGDLDHHATVGPDVEISENELRKIISLSQVARFRGDARTTVVVPIRRGPVPMGALVLADTTSEQPPVDEGSLQVVASQLAATIENSSLLLEARLPHGLNAETGGAEGLVKGLSASAGMARGDALQFEETFQHVPEGITDEDREHGLPDFERALERTRKQLDRLSNAEESDVQDVLSLIFTAHLLMLNDPAFTGAMRERIEGGEAAGKAIRVVIDHYARTFSRISDARIAEKAQDVRDLGYRLLRNLEGVPEEAADYSGQIIVARHLFPSDLVRLAVQNIAGVVLVGGALTAHIAILARSLGLPVMITRDRRVLEVESGTPVLLDATGGRLHVKPSEARLESLRESEAREAMAEETPVSPAVTSEGVRVRVLANVNLYRDAVTAARVGADGIGLYRSEFPFIIRNDFLSEEEQYRIYRQIVTAMPGKESVLRTADIGGDKLLQGSTEEERNPFLGVRGIRFSLANRPAFRDQLRAMLRAGAGLELKIMFPMVSSLEEIEEATAEISLCIDALRKDGLPHNDSPLIGAMVELPSAALAAADLAEATDFLSVGTNDLIMYLLAVDRTNQRLSRLYRGHHPTVLRTLEHIARDAGPKLSELSVCGETAADPLMVPFLLGIGVRKLSVASHRVSRVREQIGRLSIERTEQISRDMLAIRHVHDMEAYIDEIMPEIAEPGLSAAVR